MSFEWVQLNGLGTGGMQPDASGLTRDPKTFDYAVNVRSIGDDIANAGGYSTLYTWLFGAKYNTIFPYEPDDAWGLSNDWPILICGRNDTTDYQVLRKYEDGAWSAITLADPIAYDSPYRWSGGWLQKSLIISDNRVARRFIPGGTSVSEVLWDGTDSWEDNGYRALVWRPFREYMLAANTLIDSVRQCSQVRWSDAVEPGGAPDDWVPTDENRAGFVLLADTPGRIVDMVQLRDKMVIYKEDSIYFCEWVGGNSVFRFRKVIDALSISSRDSVVEHNGVHYIQADNDILMFDGNSIKSVLFGRMKRYFQTDKSDSWIFRRNCFTYKDPVRNEIVFAYCDYGITTDDYYPRRAIVLNTENNTLWLRDWGVARMSHAIQTPGGKRLYALAPFELDLWDLEREADRDGVATPARIRRTGLFSEPGHNWVQVNQTKVPLVGEEATLTLGSQAAPGESVTWRTPVAVDSTTDYKTDARVNGNSIAYQVDVDTEEHWTLPSIAAYVQKSGERK